MRRKILLALIVSIVFINSISANITGSDFLLINNSAGSCGAGATGAAKYSDISFSLINPAAPVKNNLPQISFSHLILNNNLNYEYIGIGFPLYKSLLSIHLIYLYYPESFEMLGGEKTGGTINYYDAAIILSDTVNIYNFINVGLNLKYIKREIADIGASTFGFDIGIIKDFYFFNFDKKFYNNLSIGISLKNIGKGIKFVQEEENLPLTCTFGLSYSPYQNFSFLYDISKTISKDLYHYIGVEYKTPYYFVPRIGLKKEEDTVLMTGVGVKYNIGYLDLKADYSVNLLGQSIKSHTISLNIKIKPIIKTVIKTKKVIKEKIVEKPVYVPVAINTNKKITKIAILKFKNTSNSKNLEYLTETIPESISAFLGKQSNLEVMDVNSVNSKLNSLSVKISDFNTPEGEILLGKILGVDNIIRGSFVEVNNDIRINTKLIDIKTGTIITSDQIQGNVDKDLFLLLDKTSQIILNQISNLNRVTN